jgi:hypothetical protein
MQGSGKSSASEQLAGEGIVTKRDWGKASATNEERILLEGPLARGFELWRALRIFRELIYGFRQLHFVGPCI